MLGRRLRESLRCFGLAFADRPLGWLQSAWACCITGEQCFEIALAVFAYKEGGIAAAARSPWCARPCPRSPRRSPRGWATASGGRPCWWQMAPS